MCDEHDLYPTLFYAWLKEFFDNGHVAFDNGRKSKAGEDAKNQRIERLEAKLQRKDVVLAELSEGHGLLKKELAGAERVFGHLTISAIPSSISSTFGAEKRRFPDRDCLAGSASAPASFTIGSSASARSTSPTLWLRVITGLTEGEKETICNFSRVHPLEGYRRLTFVMLDADIVACSPASIYRVLKRDGLLTGSSPVPSKKGTGFVQPLKPHQHWHVDISYLNIAGTF